MLSISCISRDTLCSLLPKHLPHSTLPPDLLLRCHPPWLLHTASQMLTPVAGRRLATGRPASLALFFFFFPFQSFVPSSLSVSVSLLLCVWRLPSICVGRAPCCCAGIPCGTRNGGCPWLASGAFDCDSPRPLPLAVPVPSLTHPRRLMACCSQGALLHSPHQKNRIQSATATHARRPRAAPPQSTHRCPSVASTMQPLRMQTNSTRTSNQQTSARDQEHHSAHRLQPARQQQQM